MVPPRPSDATPSSICIHSLYLYGQPGEPGRVAHSLDHILEPLSEEPGASHSISIRLLARLMGGDVEVVKGRSRAGEECFVQLEWTFQGFSSPGYNTRHLVDIHGASESVSFSGGLEWAHQTLNAAQMLNLDVSPTRGYPDPTPSIPPFLRPGAHMLPRPPPSTNWAKWKLSRGVVLPANPVVGYRGVSAYDELSEYSEQASESTFSDVGTSTCLWDPVDTTGECSDDWVADDLAQRQLQCECLARQSRDAEAMFAANGDTSGFLAAITAASQVPGCWDSSGMPRF